MAYLRQKWNFHKDLNPALFYNKYQNLNDFLEDDSSKYSPEAFLSIQKNVLRASYNNKVPYKKLNEFLQQIRDEAKKQGIEEDLFANLVNGINAELMRAGGLSERKELNKYKDSANEYLKKLIDIVNLVKGDGVVSQENIPKLDNLEALIKNKDFDTANREKGVFLEEVGRWIVQEAGLTGFITGDWKAEDTFFNEDTENQLIEDIMGLCLPEQNNNFVNKGGISVAILGYDKKGSAKLKQKQNKKLQNWVNSIQELNGKTVNEGEVNIATEISSVEEFVNLIRLIENNRNSANFKIVIKLDEKLYRNLQQLTVNIQSKSNADRHLTNNGKRALYSIPADDEYFLNWKKFSQSDVVKNREAVSEEEFTNEYEEFVAYTNYSLSKNLSNTIYGRNEFYLTKEGFLDLADLMDLKKFYIHIIKKKMSYKEFLENTFKTSYSGTGIRNNI